MSRRDNLDSDERIQAEERTDESEAMMEPAWTQLGDLLKEATPGPWVMQSPDDGPWYLDTHAFEDGPEPVWAPPQPISEADAALIVYLRNHAEAMERVIESARADHRPDFKHPDHQAKCALCRALAEYDAEVGA